MSSATALLADAETSIKAGEWDQALEQLENLKKDQPSQPEVYEKLALVLSVRGKFQSVIATYLELIKVLVEAENLEKADHAVTRVLELRPELGEARERRIEIENKRGNTARAVYLSRELARLCIDQGDGERSIRLLQDALKHEPGNLDIALELAEMFVSHGHIQDGANQYRKVANAFQEAGNISKAAEAYRRMKVVQSDDPEVLLTLGRLYTQLGKLDEAEQEFRSVLRHDLDHEQALLELGVVCQLKGRFRSGILAFNKVLQNNPGLVAAKRKLGELHHSQGMMTEAVDFFLQAAQGHLEAEQKDEAVECFQIVLSVDENNAPAQQGLTNLGAAVQPRAFEPPQPPTPPAEEPDGPPPPPPPPVPFDPPAASAQAPEPVGGAISERTERLPAMNFDAPSEAEPPKPEPTPRRPLAGGSPAGQGPAGGASPGGAGPGGPRRLGMTGGGLVAGAGNIKRGLQPREGGPTQGGDRPVLGRSGGLRRGLGQKDLGGGMMGGPGGGPSDKPMLAGPGDRRPTMRPDPGAQAPPPAPSPRPGAFVDQPPLEDFSADLAPFDDVFAEPAAPVSAAPALDEDFEMPGDGSFFDGSTSGGGDLFDDHAGDDLFGGVEDPFDAPAAPAPVLGDLSFDSDEDSGAADGAMSLRPDYAQEAPAFGSDEVSDDLFDFEGNPSSLPASNVPTLGQGFFDGDAPGDDLFGGESSAGSDLFGGGDDLFGEPGAEASAMAPPTLAAPGGGLFDDDIPGAEQGMFDGGGDPFANIFDEAPADGEPAAETIGGSLGGVRTPAPAGDLLFDDESAAPPGESDFAGLFDEPDSGPRSISISVGEQDDLFGGGDDLFGEPEPATPTLSAAPAISQVDDGLFGDDTSSNDLFGDEDLFGSPEPQGGFDQGYTSPGEQPFDGGDLFSGPDDGGFDAPVAGLDAPLDGGQDLASEGLFGDDRASAGLFDSTDDGLFGGAGDDNDLFGAEPAHASSADPYDPPSAGLDFGADDFGSNGAAAIDGGAGLFEPEYAGAEPGAEDAGLFEGLDGGGDTLFGDFGRSQEPAHASQVEDNIFGEPDQGGDLFGNDDGGLFGEPELAAVHARTESDFGASGGDDLFGDFPIEEERDDLHLPLATEASDDLFGDPTDGGDLFGSSGEPAVEASSYDEPALANIAEPAAAEAFAAGDLFGDGTVDDGGDLFGSDEPPAPLGLDLPMPDDPPAYSDWSEEAPAALPVETDGGGDLFADMGGDGGDLFADGDVDAPLSFDIPQPGDEPDRGASPDPYGSSEPVYAAESELSFDLESASGETMLDFSSPSRPQESSHGDTAFGDDGGLFAPEPAESAVALSFASAEPEPEPEESSEFMAMLELTMPKSEEEASVEPEPEPVAIPEAAPTSLEDGYQAGFEVEENLFEPTFDIEIAPPSAEDLVPVAEEPPAPEPDPADLLSPEQKAEIAQTMQADALEDSLAGADVASKISSYRKVLEENPDNLILRTRLADIHLKFGLLEDAVVQYRQVLRRNPDSIPLLHKVIQAEFWNENYVEAGDSLLALAKLHLKSGEHHEALDTLQSVLSLDPLHFEARKELVSVFTSLNESKLAAHHLRQLAETALTKGEVAGAISAFEQLLEISADPTFEERLAQIYESQGDVAKALASFQSLVGRYTAEDRWEEAARVTERIVELAPSELHDRESLIGLYQRLGQGQRAVEQQFHLARAYQERNELERAVSLYEEVLKVQTENQEARRHLVDAYLDAGRVSAALEQSEALTEHYLDTKDHHTAIYLYSRLVQADSENVELQERLVKFYGLAGDPENARTRWIELSDLHERHGRYDRAAEAVSKALELEEGQVDLQYRLALLYAERLGDSQSALTQFRRLFQLAPDRTDAVKMYIDLLLSQEQVGEAGQVLKSLEEAGGESVEIKSNVISALRASVEGNPADLKARFNYGELCYHLGDLDHAIEQFQQTRRHPDYELMSYNMLGLCFASKRGYMMLDLAINQFKKGLETKGQPEQNYLEVRYNLAMVQYQNGRGAEALANLKECYNVDIAFRDVRSWIQKIEGELNVGS